MCSSVTNVHALQFAEAKQLQRESAARLNGFIDELRSGGKVDLSAKNLGEEGTAYIAEGLAFNDRFLGNAHEAVAHPGPGRVVIRIERYLATGLLSGPDRSSVSSPVPAQQVYSS